MKRRNVNWYSKDELYSEVQKHIQNAQIIADIGCGISPQNIIKPMIHICCDPFLPYLKFLQENTHRWFNKNYVYINMTWKDFIDVVPDKSINTVFLKDVIEHVDKKVGKELLKRTEKITSQQIVIFTPLGFVEQHHNNSNDAWGMKGGKWQDHKSGWYPEDFDASWEIYACREYHFESNKGHHYRIPKGAFWAIKTFNYDKLTAANITKAESLSNLLSNAMEMKLYPIVNTTVFFYIILNKARQLMKYITLSFKKI